MNAGPIIHPPLITMNAGPIEHFEKWDIHKEGTQPAIRRVTDALDAERIAIREALGYGGPHFPLADHYSKDGEPWMYARDAHDQLTDSGDWSERLVLVEHRYMLEDLRLGLSFLASVAGLAGVQTPLVKAFLAIGSAITGQDFAVTGRTLWPRSASAISTGPRCKIFSPRVSDETGDRMPRRRPNGPRDCGGVRLCRPPGRRRRLQGAGGFRIRGAGGRGQGGNPLDARNSLAHRSAPGRTCAHDRRADHDRAPAGGGRGVAALRCHLRGDAGNPRA